MRTSSDFIHLSSSFLDTEKSPFVYRACQLNVHSDVTKSDSGRLWRGQETRRNFINPSRSNVESLHSTSNFDAQDPAVSNSTLFAVAVKEKRARNLFAFMHKAARMR